MNLSWERCVQNTRLRLIVVQIHSFALSLVSSTLHYSSIKFVYSLKKSCVVGFHFESGDVCLLVGSFVFCKHEQYHLLWTIFVWSLSCLNILINEKHLILKLWSTHFYDEISFGHWMFNYRWQVLDDTNVAKTFNCFMPNILYLWMLTIRNSFLH